MHLNRGFDIWYLYSGENGCSSMRESNPYCQRQEARRNGFSIKTESTLSITGTSIPMHVLRISNPIMITASSDSIINTDLNCFLQTTIMHVLRISNPIMITASSDRIINTDLNCFLQTTILLHPCAPLREAQYGIQECSSVSEILSSNSRIHLVDKAFGDLAQFPTAIFYSKPPSSQSRPPGLVFQCTQKAFLRRSGVSGLTTNISLVREYGPDPAYERKPGSKAMPSQSC
jgi:hypothetical protein